MGIDGATSFTEFVLLLLSFVLTLKTGIMIPLQWPMSRSYGMDGSNWVSKMGDHVSLLRVFRCNFFVFGHAAVQICLDSMN